jgi:nicotinate-nucleotide adenylyltransferase
MSESITNELSTSTPRRTRIAFYGGSFDPPHNGHQAVARELIKLFRLDEFVFIPAFHAPHKRDKRPVSAEHRLEMLRLAVNGEPRISISTMEIEAPERPYTINTLGALKEKLCETHEIFFVIGADSWAEITTWREWESLLQLTNFIVVTRPGYDIGLAHVTDAIRAKVVDVRGQTTEEIAEALRKTRTEKIYFTDAVTLDISATEIRVKIAVGDGDWKRLVAPEVANYIEKRELYKDGRNG